MATYDGDPPDLAELISMGVDNRFERMFTALPAKITAYDPAKQRASASPVVRGTSGSGGAVAIPELPAMPVLFMAGGGMAITYKVAAGDPCLVIFSSVSAAQWLAGGPDDAPPESKRRQSLTDGVVLVGMRQFTNALASTDEAIDLHIGDDDGARFLRFVKDSGVDVEPGAGQRMRVGTVAPLPVALAGGITSELTAIAAAFATVATALGIPNPYPGPTATIASTKLSAE